MRFNLTIIGMILAGVAFAAPVQEVFEANKEKILAEATSIIGDFVFSTGRAKQTLRAGDEIGFSKAALQAFSNLDLLNFKSAQWPASVSAEERKAAWIIYRNKHPFTLTIEGGQRIYSRKTDNDKYLVVMSFPLEKVFVDMPHGEDLDAAISQCREELKRIAEEVEKIAAERSATNNVETPISHYADHGEGHERPRKNECLNVDLLF